MTLAEQTLTVEHSLTIPGLSFRRFAGASDYPLMVDIRNACNKADQLEWVTTLEALINNYEHKKNFDPMEDLLFVEVDGQVVAYAQVHWDQLKDAPRNYRLFGWVLPEWRRKGIGGTLLNWQENRQREIAAGHTDYDGERRLFSWAQETHVSLKAMLEKNGYKPITFFADMVRPDLENIPDLPLPDGLEVRPARPEHYRAIFDAACEAFRDHVGYSDPTEADYQRWLKSPYFQPEIWKIAWDGDQVAGQVENYIAPAENKTHNRKRGYTEDISVRRPWRRRGLASALIALSLQELKDMGMEEAALSVHTDNPNGAFGLYERLGFRVTVESADYGKAF